MAYICVALRYFALDDLSLAKRFARAILVCVNDNLDLTPYAQPNAALSAPGCHDHTLSRVIDGFHAFGGIADLTDSLRSSCKHVSIARTRCI